MARVPKCSMVVIVISITIIVHVQLYSVSVIEIDIFEPSLSLLSNEIMHVPRRNLNFFYSDFTHFPEFCAIAQKICGTSSRISVGPSYSLTCVMYLYSS